MPLKTLKFVLFLTFLQVRCLAIMQMISIRMTSSALHLSLPNLLTLRLLLQVSAQRKNAFSSAPQHEKLPGLMKQIPPHLLEDLFNKRPWYLPHPVRREIRSTIVIVSYKAHRLQSMAPNLLCRIINRKTL